jgi:hypothetical protein
VTVLRYCPYAEQMCVFDISAAAEVAGAPAATSAAPVAANAFLNTDALDRALTTLQEAAASATPTAPAPRTRSPIWALLAGLVVAVLGVGVVVRFALRLSAHLSQAAGQLWSVAAGKTPAGAEMAAVSEIAMLQRALDAVAQSAPALAERATLDEQRRARIDEVARTLSDAAGDRDLSRRLRGHPGDDAGVLAVLDGANRLLEAVDHAVLRWQSHASAASIDEAGLRAIETRAEGLKPLPTLMADVAERLLRTAAIADMPERAARDLKTLGAALGERSKTARTLVDALLLGIAAGDSAERQRAALGQLQQELSHMKTSATAPERIAALKDLPPAEINARRVAVDRP